MPFSKMSEKSMFCLAKHFVEFYRDAIEGKPADLARPCLTCRYNPLQDLSCNHHIEMVGEMVKATGINFSFMRPYKEDNP